MSATSLLDILRTHNLQQYYPSLSSKGIFKMDSLAQLSPTDLSKLGILSNEDRSKFQKLSQDMKHKLKVLNESKEQTTLIRKRPPPSSQVSPERKSRRMTLASSRIIQRTPISKPMHKTSPSKPLQRTPPTRLTQRTPPSQMSARDRRLSYIPPRPSVYQRSPTTPSLLKSLTNKPKRPKFLDEPIPEPTEPLLERPPIRHLNTYGIPIARNRKITSTDTAMLSNAFESTLHIKSSNTCKYSPNSIDMNPRIRVCVRKRPLNKKESMQNETDIISITGTRTVEVNASKVDVALNSYMVKHSFTFDEAFDNTISNDQIYTRTARPLVDYVFKGGNATCFAHGQTGSGKTYTMLHPEHGLYILAARDIFKRLSSAEYSHLTAVLGFYEIYQGKLFDLLNTRALLNARDDGNGNVVIGNLTECPIGNVNQLMEIFEYGNQSRTTGKTGANNNSSRSHAVLQILLKSNTGDKGIHGKLSFIDLAGSERGADRGDTTGQTRREGAEINKSLLALKECIRALDQDQKHAPFRGSKLTQVLKDSFTGSSRTCMIATISPCQNNSEHTLNTLRYADRMKQLKGDTDPRLIPESKLNRTDDYRSEDTPAEDEVALPEDIQIKSEEDAVTKAEEGGTRAEEEIGMEEDQVTNTHSDIMWDQDMSEDLFDVEFPPGLSSTALATPKSIRVKQISIATMTPRRKQKYLNRLESPPDEIFSKLEGPYQPSLDNNRVDTIRQTKEMAMVKKIRDFVHLHREQIKVMEECIRDEKKMLSKVSLSISNQEDETYIHNVDQQINEFEQYLNDLEEVSERKMFCVKSVMDKIKEELEDEA